jgi:hypothetical protein
LSPAEAALGLARSAEVLRAAALHEASVSAIRMEAAAIQNATSGPRARTGTLRRSIQGLAAAQGDGSIRVVLRAGGGASDLGYARVQEGPEGGGTHTVIRAKGDGWLTFKVPDGSFRKVKEVRIPATRFLERAFTAEVQELESRLSAALETAARGVFGG